MSTTLPRDSDRLLEAFLESGPTLMSERLLNVIVDDIHRTRQRGPRAPWRFSAMNRFALATVAGATAVAVLGVALILTRPDDSTIGGPSPAATAKATPAPALGSNLGPPGQVLTASGFSEPFTFTLPAFPPGGATPIVGEALDPAGNEPNTYRGMRLVSDHWGSVSFHDDTSLPADMCRPTGARIETIPATPAAVGQWLTSSGALKVTGPVELTVDSRSALRWDVIPPSGVCDVSAAAPPPWFGSGERHRIYAVRTPGDTILVITWGVDWSEGTERYLDQVNAATDELVRSMDFEE